MHATTDHPDHPAHAPSDSAPRSIPRYGQLAVAAHILNGLAAIVLLAGPGSAMWFERRNLAIDLGSIVAAVLAGILLFAAAGALEAIRDTAVNSWHIRRCVSGDKW